MVYGAHVLLYSRDAEADRAFLRDIVGFPAVDAGGGWLIFGLPPAELAVHPGELEQEHAGQPLLGAVIYLMCDDLTEEVAALQAQGVACTPRQTAPWGMSVAFKLPSGGEIGLYQPTHPTALGLESRLP